jgi:hypothetical protein
MMMVMMMLTLGVQEVIHQDVVARGGLEGGILESVLVVTRAVAHILLAEGLDVIVDVVDVLGGRRLDVSRSTHVGVTGRLLTRVSSRGSLLSLSL